jgi:hypothetical protein
MTEPARRDADGPPPDDPERKPDPRAGGWADVRHAVIFQAEAVARAVAELAGRPDDDPALEMARLCAAVLEHLRAIAARCQADERFMEAERERGFAAGYAACKAERGCLRAV